MGGSWFAHGSNEVRELSFLFCGRQNCKPGEAVGPAVREHYLMHYCLSGRGVYRAQGVKYEIGPGEGFLILPGELTSYQADDQEPWDHIWVGFTGSRAAEYLRSCGLGQDRRTFQCAQSQQLEACVAAMLEFDTAGAGNELLLLGGALRIFRLDRSIGPKHGAAQPGDGGGVCGAGDGVHPQPLPGGSYGG